MSGSDGPTGGPQMHSPSRPVAGQDSGSVVCQATKEPCPVSPAEGLASGGKRARYQEAVNQILRMSKAGFLSQDGFLLMMENLGEVPEEEGSVEQERRRSLPSMNL